MNCEEFARQSEEWMEGRRTDEARAHAMACQRCRAYVEDIDAIRLLAPQLAVDAEPPERLWHVIHGQMEKEGLIRHTGWAARLADWVHFPTGPLAAAAAAALILAAVTFTLTSRPRPQPAPTGHVWLTADETQLATVDTQLNHLEQGSVRSLRTSDPQVGYTLRQNLMIVDHQIARCEKTLEEAPSDENTRDYLYDAYQQKADLLNMMAEHTSLATE